MSFGEELKEYMKLLDCNTKDLAKESRLSYMLINRYINDLRKPKKDSEYFSKLVNGFYKISYLGRTGYSLASYLSTVNLSGIGF